MTRTIRLAILPVALLTLAAGCTKSISKPEAQAALTASYKAADDAVANKNVDGALAIYRPDLVLLNNKGEPVATGLDKNRKMLETATSLPGSVIKRTTTIQSIAIQGTEVIAVVSQDLDATAMGQTAGANFVLKDIWVKESNGWHIKSEEFMSVGRK